MLRVTSSVRPIWRSTAITLNNITVTSSVATVRSLASSTSSVPAATTATSTATNTNKAISKPSLSAIDALFGDDTMAARRLTPAQLEARAASRVRVAALLATQESVSSNRLELSASVARDEARLAVQRRREQQAILASLPEDTPKEFDRDIEAETFEPPPVIPDELKPLQHTYRPIHKPNLFRAYFDPDGNPLPLVGPNEPRPRWQRIDQWGRAQGTGRRKSSTARVWIKQGTGSVWVNRRLGTEYFIRASERANYIRPFQITNTLGQFDVWATVNGGGKSGQAGAIRLGISRALQNFEPGYRHVLKEHTFLQRDDRAVQSKHFGRKKARKRFQWHKR